MITGVDVSGHQPTWTPQPDDEFVIIKATEGSTYTSRHMAGQADAARAKGLVVGFYHFMWPDNAVAQAAYFVRQALLEPGDLLVCDWESTGGGTPSEADKDAFMAEVRRLRPEHRVGLYCNASMWNGSNRQAGDFLWVAHYGVNKPGITTPWTFWQWTDNPIDQNYGQFDSKATLRSWAEALQEDDMAAKVAFRGGWTCSCVATSLPWVEADMIRRGIIRYNIDIAQLGWRGNVSASAGTHDEGGCVDTWGQWNTEAIDVWRRWGWTMQRRDLTGIDTHAHGWPYGCTHLSSAAQAQARDWDGRDAGLQGGAQVAGRWPVKHWKQALEVEAMSLVDDIAEAAADKVLARRGEIADALLTRELKLSDKAEDAVAVRVRDRLFNDKVLRTWHRAPEGGWPAGGEPGSWALHSLLRSIRLEIDDIEKKVDALAAAPSDEQVPPVSPAE